MAMGALAATLLGINNLRDREGDARANKRTLAVRLGARGARALIAGWLALALAAPSLAVAFGALPAGCLAVWLTLPAMAWLWRAVSRAHGRAFNPLLMQVSLLQLALAMSLAVPLWFGRR
jgi:1,4-dihydroxy-2-naphthoate octaprenyltransferase